MKKASQSIHSTQSYLGDCCSWYFCTSELWFKLQSTELACIDSFKLCFHDTASFSCSCKIDLGILHAQTRPNHIRNNQKHQQPLANMNWNNAKCPRHSSPGKPRAINSKLFGFMILLIQMFRQGSLWSCNIFLLSFSCYVFSWFQNACGKVHPKASCKRKKGSSVAKWPTGLPKTGCYRRHYIDLPKEWLVSSILDVHPCIELQFWFGSGTQTCCENIPSHANLPICATDDT